jgi:hypothetical protein
MAAFPLRQKVAIFDLLSKHLHKQGNDLWVYDQGWSDKRVADEVGTLTARVVFIRGKEFGKLGFVNAQGETVIPNAKPYGVLCNEVRLLHEGMNRLNSEIERLKKALGEG